MRNLSILFFLFIFATNPAYSQNTINIPADYPTIQEGINAASNGDLVLVADGTYTENINFKGKAITVASHFLVDGDETHIDNTIIDGSNPSHPDSGTVVIFKSGEDTTSVLCGFTITGGTGTWGTITRVGGGIAVYQSGAKICNNIIEFNIIDNVSDARAGGIFAGDFNNSNIIIKNNVIRNNTCNGTDYAIGGGILVYTNGYGLISNNKILDNTISAGITATGGGIDIWGPIGDVHINSNFIKGNTVQTNNNGGGGIDIYDCTTSPPVIENNVIVGNSSNLYGGGILVDLILEESLKPKMTGPSNTIVYGHVLADQFLVNNTIINNTAGVSGGGIYTYDMTSNIINCILWGNSAPSDPQIAGVVNVTYSDVEGSWSGTGNIDCDPEFLDTTYFLLSDFSCCTDAGNPDPMYNDVEDPNNPGYALYPAMGTVRNDMGTFGGPNSTWASVLSDTLYVPADYSTIQEAIEAAINGNVVLVADGTYYENINYKGKAITVASHFLVDGDSTHIENTIIDGSQPSHPDSGSVVSFVSGEDTTSVLYGFTITGGTGTFIPAGPPPGPPFNLRLGGGIYISTNMGASIINNIIEQNVISTYDAAAGGGIYSDDPGGNGYSIIVDNIIRNNTAAGEITFTMGGGICMGGSGKIVNNIITENICSSTNADVVGGGVRLWLVDGSQDTTFCLVEDNIISNNKSVSVNGIAYAGGINSSNCLITMRGNTVSNNTVEGAVENIGAGMHVGGLRYAESRIENNLFSGNHHLGSGTCYGGALYIYYSHPVVVNNIMDNNEANFGGGIFLTNNSQPEITNNTIISNTASNVGGGIYSDQSTLIVINSILWGNSAPSGEQIYLSGGTDSVRYSDIQGSWLGEGNIDADPIFEDPLISDYHLQDTSPCIQTAIETIEIAGVMYFCPPYDIEGNPRPYPVGTKPDMGAYEYQLLVGIEENLSSIVPDAYSLSQNYPNPFNPTTTINYGLKERSFVELKIYDILGREVALLINEEQDAGYYELNFNAASLASGIYLYQLNAGNFVETKKMVLMK